MSQLLLIESYFLLIKNAGYSVLMIAVFEKVHGGALFYKVNFYKLTPLSTLLSGVETKKA
ncbi:hypothetical protein I6J32_01860 [Moraxella osloensis]|nr:hypothetical protein [Moraxella osloensis]QRO13644.1 hypothetical protein I6J32_01860 [Moraxella osloensis]